MGVSVIGNQGTQGVQGAADPAPKRVPIEQIIFMLMIQQCEKKADILKADKVKLEELTAKMNKAGQLLKKLNDAAAEVGASSTKAVSTKLTPDEIKDINLLIKELGITSLFEGSVTVPSPREQQEQALTALFATASGADEWQWRFNSEFQAANGLPITGNARPAPPTEAELDKFFARVLPAKPDGLLSLPLPYNAKLYSKTGFENSATALQARYKEQLTAEKAKAVTIQGGLSATNTGRDLSSASTMMQTELQMIGQHHQSAMTDANDDLGVQNNFLQAARSFIEELLKLSSGTIQRF